MAEGSDNPPAQVEPVTDPYEVAPVVIDEIGTFGQADGMANLVLLSFRIVPTSQGPSKLDPVVAARLRFTLPMAARLRDALDKIILDATPPPQGKAN